MIRQVAAIAHNGFREASRNRVTAVIFAFALVLIFSGSVALEFTVTTFDRVMTDVGLGVMSLIAVALSIFLGSGLIPREIERRTIFMVVSRPVSRTAFVVGRLFGNLLTIYVALAVMAVLLVIEFKLEHYDFTPSMWAAIFGFFLEVMLLSSLAIFFSTWSSQMVTIVSTLSLYFVGHASSELYQLGKRSASTGTQLFGKALYYLVPNLDRFDFKPQATYMEAVSLSTLGSATVYAVGYSAVLIVAACALFERRDFK